jgi:hypothetical protein
MSLSKSLAALALAAALTFPCLMYATVANACVGGGSTHCTEIFPPGFTSVAFNGHILNVLPIVIDDEPGGLVQQSLDYYRTLKGAGVPVILRGMCVSACTFILMLPPEQVCIEPTSSLGFHLASNEDGKSLPELTYALARRYYPQPVLDWLATKKLTQEVVYMDAATVVKLGIFPACGGSNGNTQ